MESSDNKENDNIKEPVKRGRKPKPGSDAWKRHYENKTNIIDTEASDKSLNELVNKRKKSSDNENDPTTSKLMKKEETCLAILEEIDNDLKDFIFNFIKNDQTLHLNVINYVPLDFKTLAEQISVCLEPRKIEKNLLMRILDEFNVTFTLKSLNTRRFKKKKFRRWRKFKK